MADPKIIKILVSSAKPGKVGQSLTVKAPIMKPFSSSAYKDSNTVKRVGDGFVDSTGTFQKTELDVQVYVDNKLLPPEPVVFSKFKYIEDSFGKSDKSTRNIGKNLFDNVTLVDRILYKGMQRLSLDQLSVTDDFYGLANIDDDQTAAFTKVVKDSVGFSEEFLAELFSGQFYFDEFTCTDNRFWALTLAKFDFVAQDDAVFFVLAKALAELVTTAEKLSFDASTMLSETFNQVDAVSLSFSTGAIDAALCSDGSVVLFGKNFYETVGTVDELSFVAGFGRVFLDTPVVDERSYKDFSTGATDIFTQSDNVSLGPNSVSSDSVSTSDVDIFSFGKVPSDSVTTIEQDIMDVSKVAADVAALVEFRSSNVGKLPKDTVGNSESGVTLKQNYTSGTYFADNYVGTKTTF